MQQAHTNGVVDFGQVMRRTGLRILPAGVAPRRVSSGTALGFQRGPSSLLPDVSGCKRLLEPLHRRFVRFLASSEVAARTRRMRMVARLGFVVFAASNWYAVSVAQDQHRVLANVVKELAAQAPASSQASDVVSSISVAGPTEFTVFHMAMDLLVLAAIWTLTRPKK